MRRTTRSVARGRNPPFRAMLSLCAMLLGRHQSAEGGTQRHAAVGASVPFCEDSSGVAFSKHFVHHYTSIRSTTRIIYQVGACALIWSAFDAQAQQERHRRSNERQ